jgi:membrane associated rhomboid family serine protease
MFRLTPVVKNLIIINVVVFIAQQLVAPSKEFLCMFSASMMRIDEVMDMITGYLSMWSYKTDCFKPYQLFTYMFVHGGFSHILFNMLSLAFIAPILETYWGHNLFLNFYLVSGIGAAIFSILINYFFHAGEFGIMMGASGAIYGVLMGFGMMFPNMEVMLLIPPIPIKAKYLVFLLGGMTFLMDRSGQVAHFTHLGGVVVAFILILIWRKRGEIRPQ